MCRRSHTAHVWWSRARNRVSEKVHTQRLERATDPRPVRRKSAVPAVDAGRAAEGGDASPLRPWPIRRSRFVESHAGQQPAVRRVVVAQYARTRTRSVRRSNAGYRTVNECRQCPWRNHPFDPPQRAGLPARAHTHSGASNTAASFRAHAAASVATRRAGRIAAGRAVARNQIHR